VLTLIKEENTKITFVTTKEVHKLLKEEAEYQCSSVSSLVAQIVNYYLKNKKTISLE